LGQNELKLEGFGGNHFEMGLKQGSTFKEKIHDAWEFLSKWDLIKAFKPKMIPNSVFLYMAKSNAAKTYQHIIEKYAPDQAERLRGISEGSSIDLKKLYLAQALESILTFPSYDFASGCTSIGITPEKSESGETLIGRNFDFYTALIPTYVCRHNKPENGFSSIDFTICALAGNPQGMNEKGLAIVNNTAFPTDGLSPGVPISILIQEALERYETTEETVKFFKESLRGNGAILLVGDSSGDIRALEISCNRIGVGEPRNGFIVNTNHFQTEEMKPFDIPQNAIYTEKAYPKSLMGKRIRESMGTEKRCERANELLSKVEKVNLETLRYIMRNHGEEGKPSSDTICWHGPVLSTTMSLIFNLNKKSISALIGNPCQSEYREFSF